MLPKPRQAHSSSPADRTCGWGWLPYRAATESAAACVREFALGRPDTPSLAIGTMVAGLEGFRQSHREAEAARRVALVGAHPEPIVIGAEEPGLAPGRTVGRRYRRHPGMGGRCAGWPGRRHRQRRPTWAESSV